VIRLSGTNPSVSAVQPPGQQELGRTRQNAVPTKHAGNSTPWLEG